MRANDDLKVNIVEFHFDNNIGKLNCIFNFTGLIINGITDHSRQRFYYFEIFM